MAGLTPLGQFKQIETAITGVIRTIDPQDYSPEVRRQLKDLRRATADARLDIRDAEFADTAAEYKRHVTAAQTRLKVINKAILDLSSEGIFGAVEVAELSARLEVIAHVI